MKKKVIAILSMIMILTIAFFVGFTHNTYSNYRKNINVDISTDSADLICDADIDNTGTYISNDGWAYFKVIIKNYDSNNNISQVPIQYNLNVTNQSGSFAVYRYLDASGNSSGFLSDLTTRNYKFSADSKQNQTINIEVKTDSMERENVDFKVNLKCYQIEK